jgi:hypothetical protein
MHDHNQLESVTAALLDLLIHSRKEHIVLKLRTPMFK